MPAILARGRLLIAAACFVSVLTIGGPAWPQSPTLDITLTGQSMIRSDIRVHSPSVVSAMAPLLTGDVVFTNFEAAVGELNVDELPLTGKLLSPLRLQRSKRSNPWVSTWCRFRTIMRGI